MWRHGYTYSGQRDRGRGALANLDILERRDSASGLGSWRRSWRDTLAPLAEHALVSEVRSAGVLGAVQLDPGAIADEPSLPAKVVTGLP